MTIPTRIPDADTTPSSMESGNDADVADDTLLFSTSELYHEASKVRRSDYQAHARIFLFNSSPQIRTVLAKPLPSFIGAPTVRLPRQSGEDSDLARIVFQRRSAKSPFVDHRLAKEHLSRILALSCGITSVTTDEQNVTWPLRASPSGGALYPLDAYVVALTVDGISPGTYLYRSSDHTLGLLRSGFFAHELAESSALADAAEKAAACVILVATMGRTKVKYGERAYRFFLLEAGHIAQNILLAGTELGLSSVPAGGFIDDEVNEFLGIDGCTEAALYMVFVGRT